MARMLSPHAGPLLLLLAIPGCGSEGSVRAEPSLPMPSMSDALSSNMTDRSCACASGDVCANVADAVPGRFEGRALQCTVANADERTVRCRLEERFVERHTTRDPGRFTEEPHPWRTMSIELKNYHGTAWCRSR